MGASKRFMREWVAGKLGRVREVVIGSVDGEDTTLVNIVGLSDTYEDDERLQDAFLEFTSDDLTTSYWRRITSANIDLEQVSINREFDPAPANDTVARIYTLLNPTEWSDALNEVLVTLHFKERLAVTLDEDNTEQEYDLDSWVQHRGQVVGVRYRNLTTGRETPVPQFRLNENRNTVTLKLIAPQWTPAQYEVIVEAQRFYPRLVDEDWGTTCPTPLWQAEYEVSALHKIMKKYGQRFKAQFAQDLAIAERERMHVRAQILPTLITQEYAYDEDWEGPDIDPFFSDDRWGGSVTAGWI